MGDSAAPYHTKGLPPPPPISRRTIPMAGLLVDVYGLDELPAAALLPTACLWLLHPRTHDRARMMDIASRTIAAWHDVDSARSSSSRRGLIALAFDMPNHGTRLVSAAANEAWDAGNETHAVDMLGMVKGAVADMGGLMDLVEAYLGGGRSVDAHVCLGWSLGGHSAWQAWIGEERIDAAVVVVGCPDFMNLMSGRASTGRALNVESGGLIGSKYFPDSLVGACVRHDPKGILFGAEPVPALPLGERDRERVRGVLDRQRVRGKRLLLCSGARDALVPYAAGAPVVDVLADAAGNGGGGGWYGGGTSVDSRVYEGVGHSFSKDMVTDAVTFLVDAVARGPREREGKAKI